MQMKHLCLISHDGILNTATCRQGLDKQSLVEQYVMHVLMQVQEDQWGPDPRRQPGPFTRTPVL